MTLASHIHRLYPTLGTTSAQDAALHQAALCEGESTPCPHQSYGDSMEYSICRDRSRYAAQTREFSITVG